MKKLYILRHGKSSWKYPELSDFERPLNNRGKRDAPFMARLARESGISPDLILSSPALRAYSTARIFAEEMNYPLEKVETSELIYEASVSDLINVITGIDNSFFSVILAGHNPGLTSLSNTLSGKFIDNIPTCGLVELSIDVSDWQDVTPDCTVLENFEYPKKYFS